MATKSENIENNDVISEYENRINQMNNNYNALLEENNQIKAELNWYKEQLDVNRKDAEKFFKLASIYREALIALAKDINI